MKKLELNRLLVKPALFPLSITEFIVVLFNVIIEPLFMYDAIVAT